LLKRTKRGNQRVYSADTSRTITSQLRLAASPARTSRPLAISTIYRALAPAAESCRLVSVFGSGGAWEPGGSDVDVMLIAAISGFQ
jgi:hypothetical protein